MTLTETGRRLAPAISEAFARLRGAFVQLDKASESVLSVTAATTFATSWLVPRLGSFQIKHPEIAVRLDASNSLVDFAREDVDIGVRSGGSGKWPGLISQGLFAAAYTPMLVPLLLEKYGPLREPTDLLKLPLIDPTDDWWMDWFALAGVSPPDLSAQTTVRVQNQHLAGRAALAGQGVAILMPAFFADELTDGRLVQPFPIVRRSSEHHYWLVYPEARYRSPKIRAFRDWIIAEVGGET